MDPYREIIPLQQAVRRSREAEGRQRAQARPVNSHIEFKLIQEAQFKKYLSFFTTLATTFITLNPYKKHKNFHRYQSISRVSDLLRKKLKRSYLIVQEENPDGSAHYHVLAHGYKEGCLVKLKGFNIDVRPVGRSSPRCIPSLDQPPTTYQDHQYWDVIQPLKIEMEHHHLYDTTVSLLLYIHKKQHKSSLSYKARQRREYRKTNNSQVLNYMFKSIEYPMEYENYIFIKK